jgi:hypothetical protein
LSLDPLPTSMTMFRISGGLSPAGMSFQKFIRMPQARVLFRNLSCFRSMLDRYLSE